MRVNFSRFPALLKATSVAFLIAALLIRELGVSRAQPILDVARARVQRAHALLGQRHELLRATRRDATRCAEGEDARR